MPHADVLVDHHPPQVGHRVVDVLPPAYHLYQRALEQVFGFVCRAGQQVGGAEQTHVPRIDELPKFLVITFTSNSGTMTPTELRVYIDTTCEVIPPSPFIFGKSGRLRCRRYSKC
ncbi:MULTISPECIES: hypothetical protein [unclassified Micromonospora]|uniref:hypothetical protein n=1 Tax=unclassified Micromonospora TaxID=2617518 RepID=UPI002FEF9338